MSRFGEHNHSSPSAHYSQRYGCRNPEYRDLWVSEQLQSLVHTGSSLLDVGAGPGPYRALAERIGFRYFAHDFAEYVPSNNSQGLQDPDWVLTRLDYVCDILDIPELERFQVLLCSEVLEHVPDPVVSLSKMSRLVAPGGTLLLTVPLLSLMHQAPHWHASGLSPFFFSYWIPKIGLRIEEIVVHGDYVDLMCQESVRTLRALAGRTIGGLAARVIRGALQPARRVFPQDLLASGGFGVTVRASASGAR